MATFITIIHVIACIFLVLVVLLQAGKGGGMGVAFGSGTSGAVFGGRGAGSFLEKLTAGTAIVFMLTSMTLAWYASQVDAPHLQQVGEEKAAAAKKKADDKKAADDKEAREATERAKATAPDKSTTSAPAPAAPAAAPAAPGSAPAAPAAAPAAPAPAQPDKAAHPATAPPAKN